MKVIKDIAIVLKTRRPHLITEKVKNYKILKEEQGVYKLALRWELHEAQVLAARKNKSSISYMPFVYYEICMAGRFV